MVDTAEDNFRIEVWDREEKTHLETISRSPDAVVALLTALARNAELKREVALSRGAVSNGFSRGWHKARP